MQSESPKGADKGVFGGTVRKAFQNYSTTNPFNCVLPTPHTWMRGPQGPPALESRLLGPPGFSASMVWKLLWVMPVIQGRHLEWCSTNGSFCQKSSPLFSRTVHCLETLLGQIGLPPSGSVFDAIDFLPPLHHRHIPMSLLIISVFSVTP